MLFHISLGARFQLNTVHMFCQILLFVSADDFQSYIKAANKNASKDFNSFMKPLVGQSMNKNERYFAIGSNAEFPGHIRSYRHFDLDEALINAYIIAYKTCF